VTEPESFAARSLRVFDTSVVGPGIDFDLELDLPLAWARRHLEIVDAAPIDGVGRDRQVDAALEGLGTFDEIAVRLDVGIACPSSTSTYPAMITIGPASRLRFSRCVSSGIQAPNSR
jgi:hypothetical protein